MLSIDIPAGATVSVGFQMLQEDIDNGEREDCWTCPIARCINRTLPGYGAEVDGQTIRVYELTPEDEEHGETASGDLLFVAETPDVCTVFIDTYDTDWAFELRMEPITFTLEFVRAA